MALSNLISEKLEHYGGIDLKKNEQRFFSNALGISVGIHLLLILLYFGVSWLTNDEVRAPHIIIHNIAELAPPPSTDNNQDMAQPVAPPPPSNVVKPNLGVPVPVPDAIAPQLTLPNMNAPTPPPAVIGNGPANAPVNLHIDKPVEEALPKEGEFVDVSDPPTEITPIQKLVVYPEVARRSGLEGDVQADVLIGKDGHVLKVNILKSDYDIFKQAATDALMKATFTPARQNGTPLAVWTTEVIHFRLNQ